MSPYALLSPLVSAGYRALAGLAGLLPGPTGGAALAAAIVMLTVALRASLLPAAIAALRAQRARTALAPQVDRLRRRYAGDRAKLAGEISAAYRQAGISPFAGLRPALLQLVVLSAMYRIIVVPTVAGHPNAIVDATVLGAPLAGHWPAILGAAGIISAPAALFGVLLLALLVLARLSSRLAVRQAEQANQASHGSQAKEGGRANQGSRAPAQPSPATMLRLARLLPYATVGFAAIAPVAVGCYLLTTTAWTLVERTVLPHLI
jgi:YidC/Oxa1 family membrane protein insertase